MPNPPGMTPTTAHAPLASSGAAAGSRTADRAARGVDASTAGKGQHKVLELLEDVLLLFIIVFAVPAVIMLLALPIALILRITTAIGQRW